MRCKFSVFLSFLVLQYGLKICTPIAKILENKNKVIVNDAHIVHCRLSNTRIEKDYEEMAKVFLGTNKEFFNFNKDMNTYTVLHIFRQVLFLAGNQGIIKSSKNSCYLINVD